MAAPTLFGVLTGDIRKSTELSADALEFVRGEVEAALDALFGDRRADIVAGFEFFRGDAWQLALSDGTFALRAAVMIRARLRARTPTDTRIAIALGGVDRLRPERVSLSTGEAFTLSGHALDGLHPRGPEMVVAAPHSAKAFEKWINAAVGLCDAIIDDWTATQALHVALSLEHPDRVQSEIGALCDPPVTQQNIEKSLGRARWPRVLRTVETFETTEWLARSL